FRSWCLRGKCLSVFQYYEFGDSPGCGACVCTPEGRRRKRRGVVQGWSQDNQAEYMEGLHLVRGVPGKERVHEFRETRNNGSQRWRYPDQPCRDGTPGFICCSGLQCRMCKRDANGVLG